ncbi:MAG: TIGR03663 family protein [Chloroflexi bacterium]|nr:MAG: TIGR03663 family protein [Chloroflexota bacterium]
MRRWLGRAGALLCAAGIAIAPDIMYYSRFARNDIYHAVWSLLAIIGLFGFISTRKSRYFMLGAAAISLMWATKEVVFIFGFSGFTFLMIVFALEWLGQADFGVLAALRSLERSTILIAGSVALAIFVVLYTTFFTNPNGLVTGAIGAVQYWLAQQEVKRGDQPWYYYLILVPMYNYMPLLAAVIGIAYYAIRRNLASALFGAATLLLLVMSFAMWGRPPDTEQSPVNVIGPILTLVLAAGALGVAAYQLREKRRAGAVAFGLIGLGFALAYLVWNDMPFAIGAPWSTLLFVLILAAALLSLTLAALRGRGDNPLFTAFLVYWLLSSFVVYSWAGEKMPWLSLHMSLPAIVLGAKFVNDLLLKVDWASVRQRGGAWLALLLPLIVYLILRVLTTPWFDPSLSLQKIDFRVQGIASLVIAAGLIYFAYRLAKRLTRFEVLQVGFATLLVVLAAFTLRFAFMGAFEHGDIATEMLIYAQGTPDVPVVAREIDDLSQKVTGGKDLQIVVESSETWPFAWYLRDYKNVAYPASLDSPPSAPVVIAGYENFDRYKPWMTNYIGVKRKLIWWFEEDYKGMTWERILDTLSDPQLRQSLVDILFYRKYGVTLGQWPLRKEFTFYVRKDLANLVWTPTQLPPADVEKNDKELQDKSVSAPAKVALGTSGKDNGQFVAPKGLSVAATGSLFVADTNNHRIQLFDASGKFVMAFGSQGNGPGQFQEPWDVATGPDGSIYVADTWNHRIQKFDARGNYVTAWGQFIDVGGQAAPDKPFAFYGPRAVAVDSEGNVWVVDTGNKRVVKFDANGRPLGAFGGAGTSAGQFAEPVGIAISPRTGDIYIADTWNHRVQRFDKNFQALAQFNVTGWDTTSVLNKPYIALDSNDNVYVTDPDNHRVFKYGNDGKLLAVLGKPGTDLSSFNEPTGIALDAADNLFVSDSINNRVLKFDPITK